MKKRILMMALTVLCMAGLFGVVKADAKSYTATKNKWITTSNEYGKAKWKLTTYSGNAGVKKFKKMLDDTYYLKKIKKNQTIVMLRLDYKVLQADKNGTILDEIVPIWTVRDSSSVKLGKTAKKFPIWWDVDYVFKSQYTGFLDASMGKCFKGDKNTAWCALFIDKKYVKQGLSFEFDNQVQKTVKYVWGNEREWVDIAKWYFVKL